MTEVEQEETTTATPPIWQTYPNRHRNRGWTPKQRALVDAISSLSWSTDGPPDSSTTAEACAAVGCDEETGWHALLGTEYAIPHWVNGPPPGSPILTYAEDAHAEHRGLVVWSLPEDPYTDSDDWYRFRIEESELLGRRDSADFWRSEQASS